MAKWEAYGRNKNGIFGFKVVGNLLLGGEREDIRERVVQVAAYPVAPAVVYSIT